MVIFMLHSLANALASKFFNENDKYPMELYVYGIELVISSIISTFLVILAGIITGSFIECIIYLPVFSVIRSYTGGYHCMSYLRCNVLSVISYVLVFLSLCYLEDVLSNPFVMAGGYLLTVVMAIIFAPVKHENKEITDSEKKKYKILAIVMITLFYGICVFVFYKFGVKQMLVILPTCFAIDAAMAASLIKNKINERRKQNEELR